MEPPHLELGMFGARIRGTVTKESMKVDDGAFFTYFFSVDFEPDAY
jgi:hypothetical protein